MASSSNSGEDSVIDTLRSEPDLRSEPEPSASGEVPWTTDLGGPERRYERLELVGQGGNGEVWAVRDARIGRDVVLKAIRKENAGRPELEERFVREAQVQGRLEHPAIVPVYDLGSGPEGRLYFTMKHVRGQTLLQVLERLESREPEAMARFSRRKLLTAFASVCLAVDFAHSRGVLHRDLKPSNVMLGEFGEVYVLDWGIAKVVEEDTADPTLTHEGSFMGTPGYMAPEQIAGDPIGPWTDVYGLGAILFEILTLRPLHEKDTLSRMIAGTLTGDVKRPSEKAPDREIPPELDDACAWATARNRRERLATARLLADAIERYLDGERALAVHGAGLP